MDAIPSVTSLEDFRLIGPMRSTILELGYRYSSVKIVEFWNIDQDGNLIRTENGNR